MLVNPYNNLSSVVIPQLADAINFQQAFNVTTALPAAADSFGVRTMVSDSTVPAAGNFGAVLVGGGANVVPVYSDGTNWCIG